MLRARRRSLVSALALASGLLTAACRGESEDRSTREVSLLTMPPAAVLAETRNYRFGVDDRGPLRSGWSSRNERDQRRRPFVWATAEEARFALTILRVEEKQALVTLRAAPSPGPQHIDVRINGRHVAQFTAETDDREFRFLLPPAALRIGENELTFHHTFVTAGPNPRDQRRFAAAYSSLLVGPACLPLRAGGEPKPPRVEREADSESLAIDGPASVEWSTDVPRGARLVLELAMSARSAGAAEIALEAKTGERWTTLAETLLRRPLIMPHAKARLDGDLVTVAGRHADFRVVVRPRACASVLTSVRVNRAAILLQNGEGA